MSLNKNKKYQALCNVIEPIFDVKLKTSFSMVLTGASSTGKTNLAVHLIKNQGVFFDKPFEKIVWVSRFKQPKLQTELKNFNTDFIQNALPSMDDLKKKKGAASHLLLVIDDMMEMASKSEVVGGLFTHGRHMNVSVLYLTQNLFRQGSQSRDIRLNTNYLILFRNIQDSQQISNFARQMFPLFWRQFMEIYEDATCQPYEYLFLDNRPDTHPLLRIRSKLSKDYQIIYSLNGEMPQ